MKTHPALFEGREEPKMRNHYSSLQLNSGVARAPRPRGARGVEGARQEEVVAVNPWPGAQTSCLRGPENHRYATATDIHILNIFQLTVDVHFQNTLLLRLLIFFVTSQSKTNHVFVFVVLYNLYSDNIHR